MNYKSIQDLNQTILNRLHLLPRDFDLIVGVPRSGMLPANLMALYLNLPYTDLHSFKRGFVYKSGARKQFFNQESYKKILVVDDSIASGKALKKCQSELDSVSQKYELEYCVVYASPEKKHCVNYALEIVPTPRYFQWNLFNHTGLEKACFDIDGVLCLDPTPEQNDDGPKYREFLLNAAPLYIPGCKIGTLVTSRLEKYRPETEAWLKDKGIQYNELIMLDLPDADARRKAKCHGSHKANTYRSNAYNLFVESELSQALEINVLTKKPVFCTQNFEMIFEAQSLAYNLRSGKYLPWIKRGLLKLRPFVKYLKNIRAKVKFSHELSLESTVNK